MQLINASPTIVPSLSLLTVSCCKLLHSVSAQTKMCNAYNGNANFVITVPTMYLATWHVTYHVLHNMCLIYDKHFQVFQCMHHFQTLVSIFWWKSASQVLKTPARRIPKQLHQVTVLSGTSPRTYRHLTVFNRSKVPTCNKFRPLTTQLNGCM